MKFHTGNGDIKESFQRITNSHEFYDCYLKKYVDEMDKILKQEYKDFFAKSAVEVNSLGENTAGQLNNH